MLKIYEHAGDRSSLCVLSLGCLTPLMKALQFLDTSGKYLHHTTRSQHVRTGAENLPSTGIQTLDRPAHSESLYQLSYPSSHTMRCSYYFSIWKMERGRGLPHNHSKVKCVLYTYFPQNWIPWGGFLYARSHSTWIKVVLNLTLSTRSTTMQVNPRVASHSRVSEIWFHTWCTVSRKPFALNVSPSKPFSWEQAMITDVADVKPTVTGIEMKSTNTPAGKK